MKDVGAIKADGRAAADSQSDRDNQPDRMSSRSMDGQLQRPGSRQDRQTLKGISQGSEFQG